MNIEIQEATCNCAIASGEGAMCSAAGCSNAQKIKVEQPARNLKSGLMFAVACITSPCCTPLFVPIILSLIAGTPVALWSGQNLGWLYGGLTLVSVLSFVLAWRWMKRPA